MLDVARKFFTMDYLKQYVKILSFYKMNEFQIHLNDNGFPQFFGDDWNRTYAAFRLESERFPGLTAKDGSYSKQEFIDFMVESDVLKFGEFTLKSGRKSPFFMNAGAYVTGSQLKKLGEYYAKAIHETYGDDFDVLFGPAYKGIPLGVVTAIAYSELYGKEVRYCSDRKEEKDHGADKGSFLGSKLKDGDRVIMIEDVTTSGKSMEETVPKVKGAADVTIVGLMVSLNRMEVGKGGEKCALDEIKDLYGFETAAIVSMADVVEHLYNKECQGKVVIDDTLKAAIDAYYEQYGAK